MDSCGRRHHSRVLDALGFGVETSGAVEKRDAVSIFNWLWQMIAGQDGMAELPRMQPRRIQERRARRIIGVEQAAERANN